MLPRSPGVRLPDAESGADCLGSGKLVAAARELSAQGRLGGTRLRS